MTSPTDHLTHVSAARLPGATDAEISRPVEKKVAGLAGRHVLVVEDEYFIADDIASALRAAGAEIAGPVSTSDEALALLNILSLDLAILDINLRGDISFVIADALAERHIPFVFATGYDNRTIPERHAQRPRWQKPFDTEELVASLARDG